eukprot:scaffold11145_cov51-Isochrysis_galbana.AAC.1
MEGWGGFGLRSHQRRGEAEHGSALDGVAEGRASHIPRQQHVGVMPLHCPHQRPQQRLLSRHRLGFVTPHATAEQLPRPHRRRGHEVPPLCIRPQDEAVTDRALIRPV